MTAQITSDELSKLKGLHAAFGYIIMASVDRLPNGPIHMADWNEDGMNEWRWSVVAEATREELDSQQKHIMGRTAEIDPHFRFFYRVVALD